MINRPEPEANFANAPIRLSNTFFSGNQRVNSAPASARPSKGSSYPPADFTKYASGTRSVLLSESCPKLWKKTPVERWNQFSGDTRKRRPV